jgi:formylglycine-generating enzyme required for sulfatase activity
MMGSAESDTQAEDDEKPQHEVCITQPYWIGQYEVTNAEYDRFIEAGGYSTRAYWSAEGWNWKSSRVKPNDYDGFTDPNQPRVGISWYEAEAFATWAGGRFPTEAEWEYAARGPSSPLYPWGNNYKPGYANVNESNISGAYLQKTAPVGNYPNGLSWVNAYDMAGNVWEWCTDWFDNRYYDQMVQYDPAGPTNGSYRLLRGGSWSFNPRNARTAYRFWNYPLNVNLSWGVRVVVVSIS